MALLSYENIGVSSRNYCMNALEIKKALEEHRISSVEIVSQYCNRIEEYDPKIHALITFCKDTALQDAKESDKRRKEGKVGLLEGIPIVIKDNICTKGIRTTCASKMLSNFIPPYDAHVIEKIKQEGGIIIGKANLDEFAMGSSCENSAFFPTHNPIDIKLAPGGSSGGSAAAVAADMAPLSLGSDTGGSIRQPASLTGIYALRPTYGRISRYGLIALANSLDQIGPMARTKEDIALLLQVLAGKDERDAMSASVPVPNYLQGEESGKRIGIIKELLNSMPEEIVPMWENAIKILQQEGYSIIEVTIPHIFQSLATYHIIATAEASTNLARYDGIHYGSQLNEQELRIEYEQEMQKNKEADFPSFLEYIYQVHRNRYFGREVKRRILLGTYVLTSGAYETWYKQAWRCRQLIQQEIQDAFNHVDFIMTPTSAMTAFPLGEKMQNPMALYLCDTYTVPFSLSGHPAFSVPGGLGNDHLPLGLQFVANYWKEASLFSLPNFFPNAG